MRTPRQTTHREVAEAIIRFSALNKGSNAREFGFCLLYDNDADFMVFCTKYLDWDIESKGKAERSIYNKLRKVANDLADWGVVHKHRRSNQDLQWGEPTSTNVYWLEYQFYRRINSRGYADKLDEFEIKLLLNRIYGEES